MGGLVRGAKRGGWSGCGRVVVWFAGAANRLRREEASPSWDAVMAAVTVTLLTGDPETSPLMGP